MSNRLKEVTYLTVKDLKNHEIILPGKYSSTFETIAKQLQVDFTKEDVLLKDIQQNEEHVLKIVHKTNESLCSLQQSTCDAQVAIREKNEESLKHINDKLSKMQKQIDYLQKELFSDPLTGAYNRRWFAEQYLHNDEFQNNGTIVFIDLNKFKMINDQYGHLVGDQVLKYLVKFLEKELNYQGIDIVRYAGDEFMVLFNRDKNSTLEIETLIATTQEKLSKQKLKSSKIDALQFSFSYGLTHFTHGQHVEKILNEVDELMYENKQKNR